MNVFIVNEIILNEMQRYGWYGGPSRETRFDRPEPHDINNGNCEDWAVKAQELFGGREIWLDGFSVTKGWAHCVLKLDGRYYDSLHPDGCTSLRQFKREARDYFKALTAQKGIEQ